LNFVIYLPLTGASCALLKENTIEKQQNCLAGHHGLPAEKDDDTEGRAVNPLRTARLPANPF
jgi:hypothetical protein